MTLHALTRYLSARGQASAEELAQHFGRTPHTIRGSLQHWVRTGRVSVVDALPGPERGEGRPGGRVTYRWRDAGTLLPMEAAQVHVRGRFI